MGRGFAHSVSERCGVFDFIKISLGFHISFMRPDYTEAMTKQRLLTTFGACGALSLVIGTACIFTFKSIGSTLDENGVLHEPFPLLPIGWLFILGGMFSLLLYGTVRIVRELKSRRKGSCVEQFGDAKRD